MNTLRNYFDFFPFGHRCTKIQSLQVFGRIEPGLKGSETLQVSPPKFIFRGRNFAGCLKNLTSRGKPALQKTSLKLYVCQNCAFFLEIARCLICGLCQVTLFVFFHLMQLHLIFHFQY